MVDKNKQLGQLEDLGVLLHTALRKCCDSPPTSLAYNLISMEAFSAWWTTYLAMVQTKGAPVTVDKLKAAVKELDWGDAARNALHIAFDLFSDDDWAGFIAFAEEEE